MRPPLVNLPVQVRGNAQRGSTLLARTNQHSRTIWEVGSAFSPIPTAGTLGDLQIYCPFRFEIRDQWNMVATETSQAENAFLPLSAKTIQQLYGEAPPDWIVFHVFPGWEGQHVELAAKIAQIAFAKGTETAWIFSKHNGPAAKQLRDSCSAVAPKELQWSLLSLRNTDFGGSIESEVSVTLLSNTRLSSLCLEKKPSVPMTQSLPTVGEIKHALRNQRVKQLPRDQQKVTPHMAFTENTAVLITDLEDLVIDQERTPKDWPTDEPTVKAGVAFFSSTEQTTHKTEIFNSEGPAPTIQPARGKPSDQAFDILCGDDRSQVRTVSWAEVLSLYGIPPEGIQRLAFGPHNELQDNIAAAAPKELIQSCFDALYYYEATQPALPRAWMVTTRASAQPKEGEVPEYESLETAFPLPEELTTADINLFTTYPLPSLEDWQRTTRNDPDLRRVARILQGKENLTPYLWENQAYYDELKHHRLEWENGCLYRYEVSKRVSMQQIRVRVVPRELRDVILAACHASPFSGHSSEQKTLWRCQTHYWWPQLRKDVRDACKGCAHCNASNITSHEASIQLKSVTATVPFDIMCFDFWKPGDDSTIPSPTDGGGPPIKAMLTGICVMTSFVATGEVFALTAEESARVIMTRFFCVYGMPKLIIIDQDSAFKDILISTCQLLQVNYHPVTKGNHKAILCERFHRYLNKVERIHAADCETLSQWYKGHAFAAYAWNAAPIDGLNVTRSFAAIAREFPFMLDINLEAVTTPTNNEWSEWTLEHIDAMFPLLLKQRELLHLLTEDRREFHRQLKNKTRKQPPLAVGDLAIARVQVKSQDKLGPAKLQMKARGPYRILEQVSPTTYRIQRLPFNQDSPGKPHKPYVESAARLTKLPKTLVIHKHVDGVDSRWATLRHPFGLTPLHQSLRATGFGKFIRANPDQPWAFERIEDIWEGINATPTEIDEDDDLHRTPEGQVGATAMEVDTEVRADKTAETKKPTAHPQPNPETTPTATTANKKRITGETQPEEKIDLSHILGPQGTVGMPPPDPTRRPSPTEPGATPNSWPATHFSEEVTEAIYLPDSPAHGSLVGPPTKAAMKQGPGRGKATRTGPKIINLPPPHEPIPPSDRGKAIDKFLRKLDRTEDRMVFIQFKPTGQTVTRWYIAKVAPTVAQEVRQTGRVTVFFYIRHHLDSTKRKIKDCRFWPEVHEVDQATNTLGKIVPIRPTKVNQELKRKNGKLMQFVSEVNVPTDILLGPMNFSPAHQTGNRPNCFSKSVWDSLKNACKFKGVSTKDVDTVRPLS